MFGSCNICCIPATRSLPHFSVISVAAACGVKIEATRMQGKEGETLADGPTCVSGSETRRFIACKTTRCYYMLTSPLRMFMRRSDAENDQSLRQSSS